MNSMMMEAETGKNQAAEMLAENVRIYLSVQSAFEQCHPEIQAAIADMMAICKDVDATSEEKDRAVFTIVEALFPSLGVDFLRHCESVRKSASATQRSQEMAEEESHFAERVEALMKEKDLNQTQLAEMVGVGQSAISNMLKRQCRPQRRTILRIAEALEVPPEQLWDGFREGDK